MRTRLYLLMILYAIYFYTVGFHRAVLYEFRYRIFKILYAIDCIFYICTLILGYININNENSKMRAILIVLLILNSMYSTVIAATNFISTRAIFDDGGVHTVDPIFKTILLYFLTGVAIVDWYSFGCGLKVFIERKLI